MNYTYSDLLGEVVDSERFEDIANNLTIRTAINRGVRGVVREVDLKSMKRKSSVTEGLLGDYEFACPADLKSIIDFQPTDREGEIRLMLTSEENFDRKKEIYSNLITITYNGMARVIKCSYDADDDEVIGLLYYSKFGWQSKTFVWVENSTADDDLINADTEEFDLFVQKCKIEVFRDLKEFDLMKLAQQEYLDMKKVYGQKYPSERLLLTQKYY